MSEYTPGPWQMYGLDWRMVVETNDGEEKVVADVRTNQADARLIAAAPDLLAALESEWESNHAEHCTNMLTDHPLGERCMWPRPAAIEKALGA